MTGAAPSARGVRADNASGGSGGIGTAAAAAAVEATLDGSVSLLLVPPITTSCSAAM